MEGQGRNDPKPGIGPNRQRTHEVDLNAQGGEGKQGEAKRVRKE